MFIECKYPTHTTTLYKIDLENFRITININLKGNSN